MSTGTAETEDPFDDKVPTVDYKEREFLVLYDFGICCCTDLSYNAAMTLVKGKTAAHVYEQEFGETPEWAKVV